MNQHTDGGNSRSVLRAAVPLGIGLVGAIDAIIFHQLLQWHNLYVDATRYWRIFSDGLLHAFTLSMLAFGAFWLWRERRAYSTIVSSTPFWAGVLLGGGGFQLWDGVVDHKILRLHSVREGADNIFVYDIAWIASALVLLGVGWTIWRNTQQHHLAGPTAASGRRRSRSNV